MTTNKLMVGDFVDYTSLSPDLGEQRGYVIGWPDYSDGGIVMLADDKSIGMPIGGKWCRKLSGGHLVRHMQERYLEQFPGKLKTELVNG